MEQGISLMDRMIGWVDQASGFVWGPYLLIPLLLGAGAYFTIRLRFMPFRRLFLGFHMMWKGRRVDPNMGGELSPFNALMTSMAATVGTGNIVGVASAIMIGGPGAVFWMWATALVGMATKYCEAVLAVRFREVTPDGKYVGGPMYYIRKGLGESWAWLALLFALFGAVASFGIGNMTQANSITASITDLIVRWSGQTASSAGGGASFSAVASYAVAFFLLLLTGAVLLGGVKRIGSVCGTLVPFMALFYILTGIVALCWNYDKVPGALGIIFSEAFSFASAAGGAFGVAVIVTIQSGVARGLFSNEAGLGSAPIAHATAITNNPVRQGFLSMLDPFIDTIIICSITALVILVTNNWYWVDSVTGSTLVDPATGKHILASVNLFDGRHGELLATLSPESTQAIMAQGELSKGLLTQRAFNDALPGAIGVYVVAVGQILFAFSTILGWCVYGERCVIYLFGHKAAFPFRLIFTLIVPVGALTQIDLVWGLADVFNGLMALPNLIALVLLAPVVVKLTREYFRSRNMTP